MSPTPTTAEAAPAASDAPTTTAFETAHKKAGEKQREFLALLRRFGDPDQRREIVKDAATWRAENENELRKARHAAQMSRAKKGARTAVEDAATVLTDEAARAASDAPTTTAFDEFLALLRRCGDPDQRREIVKDAATWQKVIYTVT